MSKKRKAGIIVFSGIVAVVLLAVGIWAIKEYQSLPHDSLGVYEEHWEIEMPKGLIEAYRKKDPSSFHGDGRSYTIYEVSDLQDPFFNDFSDVKDQKIENDAMELLSQLEAPLDRRPIFQANYK